MTEIQKKEIEAIKALAQRIAAESPKLKDLSPEQLEHIAKAVMVDGLKAELQREVNTAKINYSKERATFLNNISSTKSSHTQRAYTTALTRLEQWAAVKGLNVLELSPKHADDFIYSLSAEGGAASSTRLTIAGCSSFFTFLERRHDHIKNPFRGTKARPKRKGVKALAIPTDEEINTVIDSLDGVMKIAVIVMSSRGLRVGALPGLAIWGSKFTTISKGKEVSGELDKDTIKAIRDSALDNKTPFAEVTETQIADALRYATKKLHKAGSISAAFSVHDLRHAYAVREYNRDKDIYRLKTLLNHASISITENYLKGLGY